MNSVFTPARDARASSGSPYANTTGTAFSSSGARLASRTSSRCGLPASASSLATTPPSCPVEPVTASSDPVFMA